jgi:hypothetical protein
MRVALPDNESDHLVGELRSGDFFLELHTPQGAVWELDRSKDALAFVGQRVEVIGKRIGFNDLRCEQIWLAGQPRPARPTFDPLIRKAVLIASIAVIAIFILRLA